MKSKLQELKSILADWMGVPLSRSFPSKVRECIRSIGGGITEEEKTTMTKLLQDTPMESSWHQTHTQVLSIISKYMDTTETEKENSIMKSKLQELKSLLLDWKYDPSHPVQARKVGFKFIDMLSEYQFEYQFSTENIEAILHLLVNSPHYSKWHYSFDTVLDMVNDMLDTAEDHEEMQPFTVTPMSPNHVGLLLQYGVQYGLIDSDTTNIQNLARKIGAALHAGWVLRGDLERFDRSEVVKYGQAVLSDECAQQIANVSDMQFLNMATDLIHHLHIQKGNDLYGHSFYPPLAKIHRHLSQKVWAESNDLGFYTDKTINLPK